MKLKQKIFIILVQISKRKNFQSELPRYDFTEKRYNGFFNYANYNIIGIS